MKYFIKTARAVSKEQQRLFGMAYALKKGELSPREVSPEVRRLAASMTLEQLREFAATPRHNLPERVKTARHLSAQARVHIKTKNFGIPERARTKEQKKHHGNYPIYDRAHARAALAYVARYGTPAEKAEVRRRVYAKYPDMRPQ